MSTLFITVSSNIPSLNSVKGFIWVYINFELQDLRK